MKKIFLLLALSVFAFPMIAQNNDIAKVDSVLAKMSARARSEIKISDKIAFIKDLNEVLADEEKFTLDDLSPYL